MSAVFNKVKVFVIVALIVLVAGMAMFGFLGFNQTLDHKASYEVKIEIDQNVDDERTVLENSAKDYFEDKGIKFADYSIQKLDDGNILIFKFKEDIKLDKQALIDYVQSKVDADKDIVEVSAEYSAVLTSNNAWLGWVLLSIGIALVASFVYAAIMEKLAGAVAVICSSVLSGALCVALVALTRLPANPVIGVSIALAMAIGAVLSIATANKLKTELKVASSNGKVNLGELTAKVMCGECKKYVFVGTIILIGAIALSAFIVPTMMFVGGQFLVAGASALCGAYVLTPILWAAIKGAKK